MGRDNASLIRSCEQARKSGKKSEFKRLSALIELSQERCPHPPADFRSAVNGKNSPSGKYEKGGTISWCIACSKVLQYVPPAGTSEEP